MAEEREQAAAADDANEANVRGIPDMPGGWATYERAEVDGVLARFDIGRVELAQEYRRGSRSAPKLKIRTPLGEFLLKRRSLERFPESRIRFAHRVQAAIARQGFPVAPLIADRTSGDTLLVRGPFAYELFRFVAGSRYDKTPRGAARAAEALARLHRCARDLDGSDAPQASFHASSSVRTALGRLAGSIATAEPEASPALLEELARDLRELYARAVEETIDLGFASLERRIVHGDWHPGNVIYGIGGSATGVAAVIDFDSARSEPWITEVANGLVQFSIVSTTAASPLDWPADFDPKRMQAFLHGYLGSADRPLVLEERSMMPWLMIEAMIAESAIPVANQGSFAELRGSAFMDLVRRKCHWVRQHRKSIASL
jgi:homoserine kinase type II